MRIESRLPLDRWKSGELAAFDDEGQLLLGPTRARGKADGGRAASMGNSPRDPTRRGGDHPTGTYRVVAVQRNKLPARSYGAAFLLLDPQSGAAYLAKDAGRAGLAIHGGALAPDGSLRATEGCLRVTDETARILADLVEPEIAGGRAVSYSCSEGSVIELQPPLVAAKEGS